MTLGPGLIALSQRDCTLKRMLFIANLTMNYASGFIIVSNFHGFLPRLVHKY